MTLQLLSCLLAFPVMSLVIVLPGHFIFYRGTIYLSQSVFAIISKLLGLVPGVKAALKRCKKG